MHPGNDRALLPSASSAAPPPQPPLRGAARAERLRGETLARSLLLALVPPSLRDALPEPRHLPSHSPNRALRLAPMAPPHHPVFCQGRPADFAWMMIFTMLVLLGIQLLLPFTNTPFGSAASGPLALFTSRRRHRQGGRREKRARVGSPQLPRPRLEPAAGVPLVFALVYLWSREFPTASVSIFGLFQVKARPGQPQQVAAALARSLWPSRSSRAAACVVNAPRPARPRPRRSTCRGP